MTNVSDPRGHGAAAALSAAESMDELSTRLEGRDWLNRRLHGLIKPSATSRCVFGRVSETYGAS
jgi:hypothetical protein